MSIGDLTQMKERAAEMGRYYYDRLGITIHEILCNAEIYTSNTKRSDLVDDAYSWLRAIEDFYAKIPFDTLHGKEEFYPLFIIKKLLPKLKGSMDDVFQHSYANGFRNLETHAITIVEVGRIYDDKLQNILRKIKIKEHPDTSDFRVEIIDHMNNV